MSAQILTTSNICVETIESIEDEFNIISNNNIIFETDNILIGNVSFTEFCSNIVFGVPTNDITEISSEDIFKVDTGSITNKDEITNMSEYELLSIDCTQITSDETYETGNKEHYINIQGQDKIYIKSENIFVKHHSYYESFHDYTYRIINNKSIGNSLGQYHFSSRSLKSVPELTDLQKNDRIADVTNMGTYVTKTILCNAVTTENIYNSTNKEAQLKLKSNSAIRLNILDDIAKNKNNIFIEDDVNGVRSNISLNQYINYRLDEYGLINIDLEAEPGVDITIYFNQTGLGQGFSNYYNYIPEFQKKKYKVNFKIVLNKPPNIETNIPSIANIPIPIYDSYNSPTVGPVNDLVTDGIIYHTTGMIDNIFQDTTNTIRYPMTNLTAGNFYNIYADVTNNYTGITYYNILTSAVNVPTIEHVVINDIKVINEREIEIDFSPHVTVVPTWYNDPYKLVYFSVKLYDHGDSSNLSDGTDFTYIDIDGSSQNIQLTYDIGISETRTVREDKNLKYRFNVNKFTNYNNLLTGFENYRDDSVIKLEGSSSDASRATSNHTFSIVSNHIAGNFEMISIPIEPLPTESFVRPNAPIIFSVQYPQGTSYPPSRDNIFQWTRSTNSDSRITKLFYEIFKDTDSTRLNTNDMEDDLINYYNLPSPKYTSNLNQAGVNNSDRILQNIDEISTNDTRDQVEGIIPGTYKIRAYNFFGQRSVFTTYEVTQLTLTNVKLTPILHQNKRWTVSYNVNNQNGTFIVTTNVTTTSTIANNSINFMTDDFNSFTTYYVWVQIQDTAMKIKSSDISVRIDQPTINISAGVYTGGASKDRRYTFTITINTKSLNNTTNFSNLLDANESLKIRSLTNVTSINNISNQSISATNNSSAIITFTVNDFYANTIYTDGKDVSHNENVSFSLIATDVYGYSSASTTLTNNIVNILFLDRRTNVRHTGNREFDLNPAYSSDFIGYEWQLNNSSLVGKTNSTLSFLDHEDNGGKFGNFRCKIRQQNAQGFTRYFYSASLNNPEPVVNNKHFEITSPTSYTFRYDGYNNTALNKDGTNIFTNSSTYQNDSSQIQMITKGSASMSIYKTAGVYKLEVFVRNQYFFGKYLEIGTYTVSVPTVPSITFRSKTYKSITIDYTLNANGTPNQNPTSVKLYMDTNSNPGTEKLTITNTDGYSEQTGLHHNTTYYFKIIKNYGANNYDSVQNTPLGIQTYNKPTAPSITNYTRSLTSITVTFNLGSNSTDPNYQYIGPSSFNITISGSGFNGGPTSEALTSTSRTFTNLLPGNTFNFTLFKTYNNTDFGKYTVTGSSSTTSVVQATAPSISINGNTINSITVNLSTNNNGSATSNVTYTLTNAFTNISSPSSSHTITGLLPSTTYNFTFTKIIGSPWNSYPYNMTNKSAILENARTADLTAPTPPTISSSSVNGSTITINYNLNGNGNYTGNMTASLYYSTSLITNANLGSSYISLDNSGTASVSTTPQYVTSTSTSILDTLTHNVHFSLENYAIDNVTIGSSGITVKGNTYSTYNLGRVQSDGTYNYLEMGYGKLILPVDTYIRSETSIDNTYYFVVRAASTNGVIQRVTSSSPLSDQNFNIHVNHASWKGTGMAPFKWPEPNYLLSTTYQPKDSYLFIVLKIKYKSTNVYDARIQYIAKPDNGAYITVGYDNEIKNITTDLSVNNNFDLGHGNFETSNFKLYEFGVLDSYVSDSVFDEIVTYLKTKYYTPELFNPSSTLNTQLYSTLNTLTHVERFSLENYAINNVTIGSSGITVNGNTYSTSGLGRVQSDGTHNYLEMMHGKLFLPAYTTSQINNTYYFVVRAEDANGVIERMTSSSPPSDDNFNIHVNHYIPKNTGMYPLKWSTQNDYAVSTTFQPKDSYIIVVLKIKYKSTNIYDARIQFIAKPDNGAYITAGYDQEIENITTILNLSVNNNFDLGRDNFETSNFKLYEFGILDSYVSDSVFDAIVTDLKNKYYNPTSQVLDTLTHNMKFSLEDYVINNVTIGSSGITVKGDTYSTYNLGRVQSDGTYNYLEMMHGRLILPVDTYITSPTSIDNTYYFVVRAAAADGVIHRITGPSLQSDDNFNIHVKFLGLGTIHNTGMYPLKWPGDNSWVISTTFEPKDSYIIIVLKLRYKSTHVYDARIQFIAKPDNGAYITTGYDQETLNMASDWPVNNNFDIGVGDFETSNFKLYEFGILDSYVSDSVFDEIVTELKNKYYNDTSQVAVVDPYNFIIKKVVESGYSHIGSSTTYSNRYTSPAS